MNILWLFDTCGYIVGPAILIAGFCAVGLCLWASRASSTRRARRVAIAVAASPVVVAICGVVFGLIVWWVSGAPDVPWLALGKVCLAGLAVAVLPLGWAMFLFRAHRNSPGTLPVE